MAVRESLNSISATGLKDITLREGRWRVGFHDSEQSNFFCNMVDGKVKYEGTVLKVRPWIFSYGVEQIWDQLEGYANLERQKSQDAQGIFRGKISAVGEKECAVCLSLGEEGQAATYSTADPRWAPSDLRTVQSQMDGKGNPHKNPQQDGARDADQHGRGKGKGQPKGKNRDWTPKDYSQQGADPSGSRCTKAGGKSGGKSGEKGGKGQGKSGNQDDSKVNGNPLYTEAPANKTFGSNKDTGGRGKGRSNEFNCNSNTSNIKGQGGKKGGGGKSFGGPGHGKAVNAVETGEEWVDEGQVQDVQANVEEEWQ